jgi:hypothetical protein
MTRISSRQTFFMKRILPFLWIGIIAMPVVIMIAVGDISKAPLVMAMPVILLIVGFVVFRHLIWDLADEVYDGGDYLLVKARGKEERIPLSNIMNVSATTMVNPPRVTLRLVKPGAFGKEVAFAPMKPFTLNAFARNAIAEDLIERVDKARLQRR